MDEETPSASEEGASAGESEAGEAPVERAFAPLPSLKPGKRPYSPRRALIIAATVVVVIALLGGVAGAVTLVQQRQRREAIATANAASAGTATAQSNAQFPPRATIAAISMYSPTDGWALENYATQGHGASQPQNTWYALRIAHGVVTRQATLSENGFGPTPILQALSSADVWALIAGPDPFLHYDGHTWAPVTIPPPSGSIGPLSVITFTMRSPTDGWAIGIYSVASSTGSNPNQVQAFYHYDGASWTQEQADSGAANDQYTSLTNGQEFNGQITGISAAPNGDVWATGYLELMDNNGNATSATGYLYHRSGGVWHVMTRPNQELYGIAMAGPQRGWIIGASVTFTQFGSNPPLTEVNRSVLALSYDGSNWNPAPLPAPSQTQNSVQLQQVVSAGQSGAWIVGPGNGSTYSPSSNLASNSDYLARFDGSSWATVALPEVAAINPNHDTAVSNLTSFPVIASGGANDLWVAGSLNTVDQAAQSYANRPLLYHYTSGQWVNVPLPKA